MKCSQISNRLSGLSVWLSDCLMTSLLKLASISRYRYPQAMPPCAFHDFSRRRHSTTLTRRHSRRIRRVFHFASSSKGLWRGSKNLVWSIWQTTTSRLQLKCQSSTSLSNFVSSVTLPVELSINWIVLPITETCVVRLIWIIFYFISWYLISIFSS